MLSKRKPSKGISVTLGKYSFVWNDLKMADFRLLSIKKIKR